MYKKAIVFTAILAAVSLSGCGGLMVTLGLEDPPPTITDAEYFNTQVDTLLDRFKQNQIRNFSKVVVLDFVNSDGRVSNMGRYLTIKFGERAVAKGFFRVTPPGQMREVLKKLEITKTGELTKEQVTEIGKALGVNAVVTGAVSDLQKGSDVDLTIKAIQSPSGELISAASVNIYRSKQVQTLLQQF